jgi:hypothetical protein
MFTSHHIAMELAHERQRELLAASSGDRWPRRFIREQAQPEQPAARRDPGIPGPAVEQSAPVRGQAGLQHEPLHSSGRIVPSRLTRRRDTESRRRAAVR